MPVLLNRSNISYRRLELVLLQLLVAIIIIGEFCKVHTIKNIILIYLLIRCALFLLWLLLLLEAIWLNGAKLLSKPLLLLIIYSSSWLYLILVLWLLYIHIIELLLNLKLLLRLLLLYVLLHRIELLLLLLFIGSSSCLKWGTPISCKWRKVSASWYVLLRLKEIILVLLWGHTLIFLTLIPWIRQRGLTNRVSLGLRYSILKIWKIIPRYIIITALLLLLTQLLSYRIINTGIDYLLRGFYIADFRLLLLCLLLLLVDFKLLLWWLLLLLHLLSLRRLLLCCRISNNWGLRVIEIELNRRPSSRFAFFLVIIVIVLFLFAIVIVALWVTILLV